MHPLCSTPQHGLTVVLKHASLKCSRWVLNNLYLYYHELGIITTVMSHPCLGQVTAYYAPQFEALREMVVEGGQPVFTACLSRCKKWLSRGGKSAVYFAKTRDERYVVKQLTRSEKQSFLDFAPAYFRFGPVGPLCH